MYSLVDREQALRLLSQGCSLNAVSRELRISRSTLREWRDHGIEPSRWLSPCPRCSEHAPLDRAAYAALLDYYLGDGCLSASRTHFVLRISCDASYPGIVADVASVIAGVHLDGRVIITGHPADFLRGLFHSDGSRVRNWARRPVGGVLQRYDYPRWQFTNCSQEIRQWCCAALDLVGVPWRKSNAKTISVSTRAGVARLDELIGMKC